MRVLRHTRFPNGHVEYEALEDLPEGVFDHPQRERVVQMFEYDPNLTEVTLTRATGTITTYARINEKGA